MRKLNLIYLPLGFGLAILLTFAVGERPHVSVYGMFVSSIIIWLLHEIFIRSTYKETISNIALKYDRKSPLDISHGSVRRCPGCRSKCDSFVWLESKDKKNTLAVCIYCYNRICKLWFPIRVR